MLIGFENELKNCGAKTDGDRNTRKSGNCKLLGGDYGSSVLCVNCKQDLAAWKWALLFLWLYDATRFDIHLCASKISTK